MSMIMKTQMAMFYNRAGSHKDLPWYRQETPSLLPQVVAQRGANTGCALDIGCGAGIYAIYLAQHGYDVTGIDFVDGAIRLAQEQASLAGVKIDILCEDILQWRPSKKFDLILDSGCLHLLRRRQRESYKKRIVDCLKEDGDYILYHFDRRHLLDWNPIGPKRIPHGKVTSLFSPELVRKEFSCEIDNGGFPIGTYAVGFYWFRKKGR